MIGTFYRSPSPESSPYVDVGAEVGPDTVVCIIEAMKVMNEIKAEVRGVVTQVLVDNAKPVEFGQPLFKVRPQSKSPPSHPQSKLMFEKILVANRGEIAVRIIRACKELNVRTVAVYSEADANSMHVQMADEAICIGKPAANESYLRIDRIISAAEIADVDAIHPGYGFLSENAHFADVCESCNIRFIGPNSRAMSAMEDKAVSRALAKKAGVPTPPGSEGVVETEQEALAIAKKIGYPVLIKAVAGGGGRGMRIAHNDISLVKGLPHARREAEKAFGNSGVYIEKFIENPHHIEFQILADNRGNTIHLGERDCSIQRRNQKLIEETPSPMLEREGIQGAAGQDGQGCPPDRRGPPATPTPARSSSS